MEEGGGGSMRGVEARTGQKVFNLTTVKAMPAEQQVESVLERACVVPHRVLHDMVR